MDRLPPSLTKGRERSPFNGFDVTGIQIIQGPNVGTRHWVGIQKKKIHRAKDEMEISKWFESIVEFM